MRTVIVQPHQIERLAELELPLQAGEVRLRPLAIGVCGSDLHVYEGQHPFVSYPVYPGHEVAARVIELGSEVSAEWAGALVALEPSQTCGECDACRSGRYNICDRLRVMGFQAPGALATSFVSPVSQLHRLPDDFDPVLGAMVEPLAVAVHAARLAVVQGSKVAVLGAGTIGLLMAQVARAYGAAQVEVIDLLESRRKLAQQLGLVAAGAMQQRYEVVFECVGVGSALEAAIQQVSKGGQIVVVGVYGKPVTLTAGLIQDWEIGLKGSLMYTFQDYREAIRLLATGWVQVEPLITHRFAMDQVEEAFTAALDRETALKVMLLA